MHLWKFIIYIFGLYIIISNSFSTIKTRFAKADRNDADESKIFVMFVINQEVRLWPAEYTYSEYDAGLIHI